MAINDHSRFAPSAFEITVNCPGSVRLQAGVPEQPETDELAEGSAAHYVAAVALASGVVPSVGSRFELNGRTWDVDEDMHDGAVLWADTMGPGCTVEDPVSIARVHPQCWGTPDAWQFYPDFTGGRLRVGDYKYGHRYVSPFENLQVAGGYAVGILERLGISPGDDETVVEIVIVQPRAFHRDGPVQIWRTTPFKLQPLVNRLREAVAAAELPQPPTVTGRHCKDCKARHVCGTLRNAIGNVVDYAGTADAVELDTVAAATELVILDDAAARLEARRTGLYAQVEAALRDGKPVPYYALEPGQSRLEWAATVAEVRGLGAMLGVDLSKPETVKTALLTPTQAIKKGLDAGIVAQYADRRPAGVKVVRNDSTKARRIFGQ